eukprot:gene2820-3242_t
MPKPDLYLINS